ncbi:MAG: hypothetical protein HOV97_05195 [Nonomuraea sp.]|nr:hypothetical protein [Nonomuraea sp.]
MKITVWNGCSVVEERDYPQTAGPDLHIDPWNLPESISVRRPIEGGGMLHESVDLSPFARGAR